MKKKSNIQSYCQYIQWMIPTQSVLCFSSSKDDKVPSNDFSPDRAIPIFKINFKGRKSKRSTPVYGENYENAISKTLKSNIQ